MPPHTPTNDGTHSCLHILVRRVKMGKADLKKIPDKLTDAEKKKVKNDNVSIQISRVLLQLTPHFPALPPLLRTCTFRDRHLPHHPPPATSSWVSTGNTEHLSLSGTEHLSLSWSALPVRTGQRVPQWWCHDQVVACQHDATQRRACGVHAQLDLARAHRPGCPGTLATTDPTRR